MLWRAPNNIQLTAEGMKLASVMNVTVFEDPAMKDADKFHELTHVGKSTLAGAAVQAAVGFFASVPPPARCSTRRASYSPCPSSRPRWA